MHDNGYIWTDLYDVKVQQYMYFISFAGIASMRTK